MKPFIDRDFLLPGECAARLYHEAAAGEPVFDYHCHLKAEDIALNRRFSNLAVLWLGENRYGDHYKWRAMRANGIDEELVSGNADPYDRFMAWAATVPALMGNPLYHWTHLELQRYFDIYEHLNPASAPAIWKAANEKLEKEEGLSVCGILKKFRVYALGTTDDPADSLEWHRKLRGEGKTETMVLPSFRPDNVINIEKPGFPQYIARLGKAAGRSIGSFEDLLLVLKERVDFFDREGCCSSDHGLEYIPWPTGTETDGIIVSGKPDEAAWEDEAGRIFAAALAGKVPGAAESELWKSKILVCLAGLYAEKGWAMQLHLSAIRNVNSGAAGLLGPDTGYDAVHDYSVSAKLSGFLDYCNSRGALPKTILYSLNPKDFYPLASIMGCFQGNAALRGKALPGKMQLGSSWWFLDHIDGMEAQMRILANTGLLSRFIGMLTDSRSFLSYPRHEYFRRILCRILGAWMEEGEIPADYETVEAMVRDISFGNAKNYFLNKGGCSKI
ncbi:MAG: glucuronate isomerase [Treponema sp.]|nr:glucuronate isomerase [Treponema sp.]